MNELPFDSSAFSTRLLGWYGKEGRALPWRETRDPYRIWLSEIMLQQTTVAAVIEYYLRFLKSFPTLQELALASQEEVINLWAGLGYYSRARNLHATAQTIMQEHGGVFPDSVDALQQLPGIGRSTAGAIAALAFDQQAPILDGNVRRVLCRLCALQQPPRSTTAEKQLWRWTEQLTPADRVHDYTQAIMDLGAMICVPHQPHCEQCPVVDLCQAKKLELEQQLPMKQPKKAVPTRQQLALLIEVGGRYLVRRRPMEGFLGGLWEFPSIGIAEGETVGQQLTLLKNDFSLAGEPALIGSIKHIYSHFRLELQLYHVAGDNLRVAESGNDWCTIEELNGLALHGAHKKALKILHDAGE